MIVKNTTLSVLLLSTMGLFAQEVAQTNTVVKPEIKISYLDSVKKSFVNDEYASRVDSLWMKELVSLDIYEDLTKDIQTINSDAKVDYELPTELLKQRLAAMNEKSPFNIQYNQGLENIIKSFLKNRKKSFSRLMALSEYYFPMFEEAFAKQNVPLEIKYLAVVESALNPKAVSKMGATGLWQFMYHTGKQYNLKIDSFIDERSDPLKASVAAADYMSKMFKIFGDWELVLASYNSGPGNVSKAIRRSGGKKTYWDIRNHLPKETQGYVPAFLATMYLYEYHKEHGINPDRAVVQHFETDTIRIKEKMTFKQISNLLDVPEAQLQLLNPSYKLNVVPFYQDEEHFLRLPKEKASVFASNEDKIYAYLNYDSSPKSNQVQTLIASTKVASPRSTQTVVSKTQLYKVRSGDNLGAIASKYNVSIVQLKKWNNLKSNSIALGRNLKIISETKIIKKDINEVKLAPAVDKKRTEEAIAIVEDKNTKEPQASLYVVQTGDNLSSIARKLNVSVADLKEWNGLTAENMDMVTPMKKLVIQSKEEESDNKPEVLVASNSIDTYKKKGTTAKNNAIDYYVKKGDSLYSIAKKYPGVTISDIKKWNDIENGDIKPGMKLKING
ncbi:LysM peptidoglycan-binding domain-containing protein [Flavobacterium branchiarum]|uniref:LysM peptidoglycan-binding domain-containing protein n=1 Tax=Flavobacterium branchiarum TaxID=1114870 RepID=A0ABV5FJR8_9FLAO|nr:LysM peptidoglycan-binding domain-containing protein [Flavobacterium branchiarum]MDN3675439.1 LysM peptidoglycan-binding domain-containing protein [Flavobacterium branchiarum]